MSLLLKALQKSEAERNQAQMATPPAPYASGYSGYQPAMGAGQGNTIIHTGDSSAWLAVVLGCNMMLIIAIAFFWFQGQQQSQSRTDNLVARAFSREAASNAAAAPTLEPVEQSLAKALQDSIDGTRASLATEHTNTQSTATQRPESAIVRLDSVAAPAPLPQPVPETQQDSAGMSGLQQGKLYQAHELDSQVLATFPQLNYNAHLYSPDLPSARMFMANDTRYTENDQIDKNTRVESIVPEGVIFNFKGLRVKVNVVDKLQ